MIRRLVLGFVALVYVGQGFSPALSARPAASPQPNTPPLTIRITSPLGRTGTTGAIRIVAQVTAEKGVAIGAVRFYVDNTLVGEDPSGPPFAVEWTDENPFEAREISVNVADSEGNIARDSITLKPGQEYVLADKTVPTDYYRATSYSNQLPGDGTVIRGQEKYYQIWVGHRFGYVKVPDVNVITAGRR